MPTTQAGSATEHRAADEYRLPAYRLNLMRFGYLVMGVGLVVFRWPSLLQASSLSVMEGAVVCLMVALSLLAFLGLRYPIAMMPVLVFEVAWKLLWLAVVAVPHLLANDMDAPTEKLFSSVLWVVIIIAVTPWDYVWKRYVKEPGDRWRRSA
ncbi:hypothetical protein ACFFGH_22590 [Lysobacter korlensis]|uniref:Transmembrane protein n=1 Tax=Lysobacter korlensis TaxID=553636 RepID=A0ABV6RUH5_9GAMM